MAKLVVLSEGLTGKTHELKVDKTTIGRVDDNTFPIAEPSISSHHCEVLRRGNEVVVRDLHSTNGTFINGQQVSTEAVLKPGQILRLGQVEIRLEDGEAKPAPAKKMPDQTAVLPQGVKLGYETATGTKAVPLDKGSGFAKKSNNGTKIFIAVAVVVVVLIVSYIVINVVHAP